MKIFNFIKNNQGATAIEYAFIAMLVSIAIIIGVVAVGVAVNDQYTGVATDVSNAMESARQ
jgi:Flp pilus assembly pilin Flp